SDRPAAEVVPAYFAAYERRFGLQVRRPVRVHSVRRDGDRFLVTTDHHDWRARAIVNATGTWERPHLPYYPGIDVFAGHQLHSADYQGPEAFDGLAVVVVGGGHSALDRKSTRLNSSHVKISYAVFCLKDKKTCSSAIR